MSNKDTLTPLLFKKISLTKGRYTLVDNEDFDYVNQWKWSLRQTGRQEYAVRIDYSLKPPICIRMHRLLAKAPKNMMVDHINGDPLDNRKANLRICTNTQNLWNSKGRAYKSRSGYKGVDFSHSNQKWRARIKVYKKEIYLGCYDKKEEAARAYDRAARSFFREFSRPNFI